MIDEIRKKMEEGVKLTGEEINLYYSDEMGLTQLNQNNNKETTEAINEIAGLNIDEAISIQPAVGKNLAALNNQVSETRELEQGFVRERKRNVDKGSTDVWLLSLMTLVLQPLLMYIVYNFIK